MIFSRFLLGAAEAPIFPGNAHVVRSIFPLKERGRATAIFDVGSYFGAAVAGPLTVFIIALYGWRYSFYFFSVLGIVWAFLWYFIYNPKSIPKASAQQINLSGSTDISFSFYIQLLKNRKVLGICLGFFCYNYTKNFFLTWFPTFLINERNLDFIKVGYYSLIPPAFAVLGGLIAGYMTDLMLNKGVSLDVARKLPLCVGMLGSSVIVLAAIFPSIWVTMLTLSLAYFFLIASSPGIWAIPGDLAITNNEVGRIGGIQNTFSNIAGIVAPIITGILYQSTDSFVAPLALAGVVSILGAFSYWYIVGSLSPINLNSKIS